MPKSVTATRDEQIEALEDAFELVESDVDEGEIDAHEWGGSIPDGEKLRVLAEAYRGTLEVASAGGTAGGGGGESSA